MFRGWNRNISIMKHILESAAEMEPSMRLTGRTVEEFEAWKEQFKAKLLELLGPFPQRVPTNARTIARIERDRDVVEKFVIDVEGNLSAPGLILIPKDMKKGEKRPAILVCHGHCSPNGKIDVAGLGRNGRETDAYAKLMTDQGYVTVVIDSRGFAERSLPVRTSDPETRCNYLYLLYAMLGYNVLTLNVHDQMQTIDYMLTRPEIDGDRIGVVGRSYGGTQAQYVGVCDERIKAVAIACYMCTTLEYTFEDVNNNCGTQFVPGLYRYGDVATVAGLIAPRPLLVQSGFADQCFAIDSAAAAHEELRGIYSAAGAEDRLTVDIFDGPHDFHPPTAYAFFEKWLGPVR